MRAIVRHQLEAGVHGFYVCGGTGEGLLQTVAERRAVLETVLDEVQGRAGVIAHVGAFQTPDTLALARHASDAGADAIAALPPAYFYKPDEPALLRYYMDVASSSDVPLLIYNIPARTGIAMTPDHFEELLRVENIIGMKDSSGDIFAMGLFLAQGENPVIFNGEDSVQLAAMLAGACGGIGASYNVMPGLFVKLWDAFQAKDIDAAAQIQLRLNVIMNVMDVVELFGGLKQIMAWMGLECGLPRSPLGPLTGEDTAKLRRELEGVGFFDGV
jgi:N-acetylneuraminate lyase